MRIAVLTNAYPPGDYGGAARIAAFQVEWLQAAGDEVRVWRPMIAWFAAFPAWRVWHHLKDLGARSEIVREIVAWHPDILLTHNLTGCGFSTPRHIQATGIPWVHVLHDVQLFQPSGKLRQTGWITAWQRLWSCLRRSVFGAPDLILSPTQWLIDLHRLRGWRWPEDLVCVLPNPGPIIRQAVRLIHQPLRLLYVGRVADDKGARLLVRLIRELHAWCEMFVIGTGPGLKYFSHSTSLTTTYGQLPTAEVLSQMESADVLLVPSDVVENQPTVILEAAALGLPVIASDQPGIKETLNGAGQLCAAASRAAWVMAIERLKDPQTYQAQVKNMYRLAAAHDAQTYTQTLRGILEKIKARREISA